MKKHSIRIAAFCLALTLVMPGFAFAETAAPATAKTAAVTIPTSTSVDTPVKLSLEATYEKILKDSATATLLDIQKKYDEASGKGSGEALSRLKKADEAISEGLSSPDPNVQQAAMAASWSLDTSNKGMLEANRDFALAQTPKNHEARVNALKADLLESYYQLQFAEAGVKLAKDNLDVNNKVLENTKLMFNVGTRSKSDVLKAEVNLNTAKAAYTSAVNGLNKGTMEFNKTMGYNINQKLELTSKLETVELPSKALDATLASALQNRNEMAEAKYNAQMAEFNFNTYKAYPSSSSKHMDAKASLESAKQILTDAPVDMEIDVRSKYAAMKEKHEAVQLGKASVANADENIRLATLQYNAGLVTLTDMEGIVLSGYKTKQEYQQTLLDYAKAVNEYNLAGTSGTKTVALK